MAQTYEIVILGNNLAGVSAAHYILKHTIPALETISSDRKYRVTVVGPSKYIYFKIAAPRSVVSPELVGMDQITFPMAEQFVQYKEEQFTWVQGLATDLDQTAKSVVVDTTDGASREIHYDSLIVATGSKLDPLWAANDDFSATQRSFEAMHNYFPHAKKVLIGGGGSVGVETAGEVQDRYPQMTTILAAGASRMLPALSARTSSRAETMLARKGVTVLHSKKVVEPQASVAGGVTVKFDDGTTEDVDIYIHAVGGRPNTTFLPAAWLNERQKVEVDYQTNRGPVPDVYALGDAASNSNSTAADLHASFGPCMSALAQDILAKTEAACDAKTGPFRPRTFKPMSKTQVVPIGRDGGVGEIAGWGVPSLMVWLIKSRSFMVGMAKSQADGSDHAAP